MEWILDNEPQILIEISKFWIYNSFSISNNDETGAFFQRQLLFILGVIEQNFNIVLYSEMRFKEWLSFIKTIPWSTPLVYSHVAKILQQLRIEHIIPEEQGKESLLSLFVLRMVACEYGIKKEDRSHYLNLLLNEIVSNEKDSIKFEAFIKVFFEQFMDKSLLSQETVH